MLVLTSQAMLEIQCSIHLIHHSFSLQSCTKYGLDILIAASAKRKKIKTLLPTFMYFGTYACKKINFMQNHSC